MSTRVRPAKDTTYIVGPIASDGYLDYVTAINDLASRDVTVENNAAVLLVRACGLPGISDSYHDEFLQRLGVDAPVENYFTASPAKYAEANGLWSRGDADEQTDPDVQVEEAISRPWSADEFPLLAQWLEASELALSLALEASQRPKYYEPFACGNNILPAAPLPVTVAARGVCRALTARAMFKLAHRDFEAAWPDLLACHRLARHVASSPTGICSAVALAMERMACRGDHALACRLPDEGQPSARYLDDLNRLAPLHPFADKLDSGERLIFLDSLLVSPRRGRAALVVEDDAANDALELWVGDASKVDWNEVLRQANTWYDRGVAALRLPDHRARSQALDQLDRDIRLLGQVPKERMQLAKVVAGLASQSDRTRAVTAMLVCLQLPTFTVFEKFELDAAAMLSLTRISFALTAWHKQHGSFPPQLDDLVPDFLHEIPKDPFSGESFLYRPHRGKSSLYSVGPNANDDDGFSLDPDHPDADDISLESGP
jgi:hypothetical protein